jgi:hypothetical protein
MYSSHNSYVYLIRYRNVLIYHRYLGFSTVAQPSPAGMYSCIANLRKIFARSWQARSGSLSKANLAASGLSENNVGTGPDTASPSNRRHERGHSSSSTVGTRSLNR